jgi:Fe-S-cluster containining protein
MKGFSGPLTGSEATAVAKAASADSQRMEVALDKELSEIANRIDGEFKRNRRRYGRKILCAAGCSDCCHHLFSVTEIEAAEISLAIKCLPSDLKSVLQQRARVYEPARQEIMRRHGYIQARGNLPAPETRLACPALIDHRCAIYHSRPLICRRYGMPVVDPTQPSRTFACELNFSRGETIDDTQLVTIQTAINDRWSGLQRHYDQAGGRRAELPISVAQAIMEDFEPYLP